jgi:hypothetical protein
MVAVLLGHSDSAGRGFALSLQTAAGALLVGVTIFGWLVRRHPVGQALGHAHQ